MPYKNLEQRRKRARERYHEGYKGTMLEKQRLYRQTMKGKYSYLKARSKSRNIEMLITENEYINIITEATCFYCYGELPLSSYGLDRKDNDIGYTIENVVPCCKECNTSKNCYFTHQEWKVAMEAILRLRSDGAIG